MARKVDITVGRRTVQLMCPEGQEDHLRNLATSVSERIERLSEQMGGANDTVLLVTSALMMQDEINDMLEGNITEELIESEVQKRLPEAGNDNSGDIIEALNAVSDYVDSVTQRIEDMG